jgi:hypothetical protein
MAVLKVWDSAQEVEIGGSAPSDAADITYTPDDASDWPSGDPGNVDDALDTLAMITGALSPAAAPAISQIDFDTAGGVAGKPTWPPDGGYVNTPGGVDVEFGTAGTENGVFDATTDFSGDVQPQITKTVNYDAGAFNVPVSDTVNDLKLLVNGSIKHTVNLNTHPGGSDVNGNGSGFTNLGAMKSVTFDNGDPFDALKYVGGQDTNNPPNWTLDTLDLDLGYNEIKVQHVTDSGTVTTTIEEVVRDDDTTACTYAGEVLDTFAGGPSSRYLSGVQYYAEIDAEYDCTISNAYRNTWKPGSGQVTFVDVNGNLASLSAQNLAASGGDETKQHVITNKIVDGDTGVRILGGTISVKCVAARVLPEHGTAQSSGVSLNQILFDAITTPADTDLIRYFNNELKRYHFGSDFNSKVLAPNWDNTKSLVGIDADYNDGIQVYNSKLWYPQDNFSGLARGPGGNPDYSGAAGVRYYADKNENATGTSSFRVLISGSFTLISDATAFGVGGSDKIKVALRWPTQTGWLDLAVAFNEGDFGAVGEAARFGLDNGDSLTHGCYSASLDSGGALGVSIGTKTTSDSGDRFYLRVICDENWSGNIDTITVTWNAS